MTSFRLSFIGVAAAALLGSASPAAAQAAPATGAPATAQSRWSVRTAEHVDLWLHAFALLSSDSAVVPLYRRGYRDSVSAVRSRANVLTSLDGNRASLAERLAASPNYLQAQFLPFEFPNWDTMRLGAEQFLQYQGNPQRAPNREVASSVALFGSVFGSAADRDWLRLFLAAVQDERTRFFGAEHARALRERAATIAAVDTLWRNTYQAKFERFLNNTGQRTGELLLSLPLGGEGRTGTGRDRQTIAAVGWPDRPEDAREAILTLAHEVTGSLVGTVVTDNTTPAEKRDGLADRYVSIGQTRAGAMLLEKIAPELVEPYMRFYLAQAGARVDGTVASSFQRVFDAPKAILDGLQRQIEIVLAGI